MKILSRLAAVLAAGLFLPQPAAGAAPQLSPDVLAKPKILATETVDSGGTLIFSDSPEYVTRPGILYSDIVSGEVRVLCYHVNYQKQWPLKVGIVLESAGKGSVVHLTRGAFSSVVSDYAVIGRPVQEQYFSNQQLDEYIFVGGGRRKLLVPELDKKTLQYDELVYGVYDFTASEPVRVSVIAYPAGENAAEYAGSAEQLPRDEVALRGSFGAMNRKITLQQPYNPEQDGAACIVLGNDRDDLFREGTDATDGSPSKNFGNYGINYELHFAVNGSGRTHYYLEPLGGNYGGAVRVHSGQHDETRLYPTPAGREYFGENGAGEYADLGCYDNSGPLWFEFSPPGAANLPVRIWLVPEKTEGLASNEKKR